MEELLKLIVLFTLMLGCQLSSSIKKGNMIVKNKKYDVLVIGGSHAGLSAAMALGRLRRSTLVVDAGKPRNQASEHANNLIGMDGIHPDIWRDKARADLKKYKTIEIVSGKVIDVQKIGDSFKAQLENGQEVQVRKLILAYGIKNKLPDIEGIWEHWGKSVFHCPYCHGFEFRDQRIGMVIGANFAEHMVPMMINISKDLVLFTEDADTLSNEFRDNLKRNKIKLITTKISSLESEESELKYIVLENGEKIPVKGIIVGPIMPLEMNANFADELNLEKDEMGFIKADMLGETSMQGVFAAGDIMTMQHSVLGAAATGQMAGAGVVGQLSQEEFN
tara:strand:- start:21236 stop:22237 length:1002 start_codon:yes stop_codon:yes gene_type:complete